MRDEALRNLAGNCPYRKVRPACGQPLRMRPRLLQRLVLAFICCAVILGAIAGVDTAEEEGAVERAEPVAASEVLEDDAARIVSTILNRTGVQILFDEAGLAGTRLRVEYDKNSPARTLRALAVALESVDFVLLQQGESMLVEKFTRVADEPRVLVVAVSEGSVEIVGGASPLEVGQGQRVLVHDDGLCSKPTQVKPEEIASWRRELPGESASASLAATINAPVYIRLVGTTKSRNLPIIECGVGRSGRSMMFGSKELKAEVLEVSRKNVVLDEEQGEMQIILRVRINVQ